MLIVKPRNVKPRNRSALSTMAADYTAKGKGFTLIEVLVAMVILAIGLLGLAGLQTAGMSANQGAFFRSQATHAISDILDRMRANSDGVAAGYYSSVSVTADGAGVPGAQSCISSDSGCGPEALANHDIRQWARLFGDVDSLGDGYRPSLPGATGEVSRGSDGVYTITVTWQELDWSESGTKTLADRSMSMRVQL